MGPGGIGANCLVDLLAVKHRRMLYRIDFTIILDQDSGGLEEMYKHVKGTESQAFFVLEYPPAEDAEALSWTKTVVRLLTMRQSEYFAYERSSWI